MTSVAEMFLQLWQKV